MPLILFVTQNTMVTIVASISITIATSREYRSRRLTMLICLSWELEFIPSTSTQFTQARSKFGNEMDISGDRVAACILTEMSTDIARVVEATHIGVIGIDEGTEIAD